MEDFAILSFWGFILTGTAAALFVNLKFCGVLFAKTHSWQKYLLFCLLSLTASLLGSALYLLLIFLLILCIVIFGLRVFFGGSSRD